MRRRIAATVMVLGMGLTVVGCGDGTREDLVVTGASPATPYRGPLDLPFRETDGGGERDAEEASGAAGQALECDGEIYWGNGPEAWSKEDSGSTPEEGLDAFFGMVQPELPDHGYRIEREEGDRVLFSYDVDDRTKVAVVVAKDQPDRPGWGAETSAGCDPAELPAGYTDSKSYEIWTDRDGHRVATTVVSSYAGAEHCDFESAHFLGMGRGEDVRQYARDPRGVLESDMLTSAYDGDVRMPADAHDTGYRFEDWQLWLTDDRTTAYVRTSDGVEAWPESKDFVACK